MNFETAWGECLQVITSLKLRVFRWPLPRLGGFPNVSSVFLSGNHLQCVHLWPPTVSLIHFVGKIRVEAPFEKGAASFGGQYTLTITCQVIFKIIEFKIETDVYCWKRDAMIHPNRQLFEKVSFSWYATWFTLTRGFCIASLLKNHLPLKSLINACFYVSVIVFRLLKFFSRLSDVSMSTSWSCYDD